MAGQIAKVIMKNSSKLLIDLNITDSRGKTAFHRACMFGHTKIVNKMIEQSDSLELDLEAVDNNGKTGYQVAKANDKTDVVKLIKTKMPSLAV